MSQNNNNADPFMTAVLIFAVAGMILAALWFAFGVYIIDGMRWLRVGQLWILEQVTGSNTLKNLRIVAVRQPAVTWPQVLVLSDTVMYYLKWPMAAVLIAVGWRVVSKATDTKFKKKYDIESLVKAQVQTWPVISPILKFNPTQTTAQIPGKPVPTVLPLFAEALSPEEWIAYSRIPLINNIPEREATRRAFMGQLGGRWASVADLPPHLRALFAAFALKIARKRQEADDLLGKIAMCWTPEGGLALTAEVSKEIDKAIADPASGGEAIKIAERHAWVATAMLGVLKQARDNGGVLAPATFLWLRGQERALWYPLNNLGRQAFHVEASGAMAHFMAELNARHALTIPRLEPAVDAIMTYFTENRPTVPPLEEAKSVKIAKPKKK